MYNSPTLYDVSGSSDFRNQTHDGFSIYRFFGDDENEPKTVFENLKTKMKFQGEIGGQIEFDYHLPSGRYFIKNSEVPNFVIWEQESKIVNDLEKPKQITISPEEAFDVYDDSGDENDVPF